MNHVLNTQQTIFYSMNLKDVVIQKRPEIVKEILKLFTTESCDLSIYFLAISIMDRFISKKALLPNEYKNLARASFTIAFRAISEEDFLNDDQLVDILVVDILNCLNFHIYTPTLYTFLQFHENKLKIGEKFRLLETLKVSTKIQELVMYFPSEVFQACLYITIFPEKERLSNEVQECVNILLRYLKLEEISFQKSENIKLFNPRFKNIKSNAQIPVDSTCLSVGEYGRIYKDKNIYKKYTQGVEYHNSIIRELGMLRYFTQNPHKNVLNMKSYFHSIDTTITEVDAFEYNLKEFCTILKPSFESLVKIMKQILEGVGFIHENGFMHRDLKPENIVVNRDLSLKVIDMGLSRKLDGIPAYSSTNVITSWYRPLELFQDDQAKYGYEIDVWSVGCIFYEIFCGKPLLTTSKDSQSKKYLEKLFFVKQEDVKLAKKITQNHIITLFPPTYGFTTTPLKITKEFLDLLTGLLQVNPKYRISCKDALNHEIFLNVV